MGHIYIKALLRTHPLHPGRSKLLYYKTKAYIIYVSDGSVLRTVQ